MPEGEPAQGDAADPHRQQEQRVPLQEALTESDGTDGERQLADGDGEDESPEAAARESEHVSGDLGRNRNLKQQHVPERDEALRAQLVFVEPCRVDEPRDDPAPEISADGVRGDAAEDPAGPEQQEGRQSSERFQRDGRDDRGREEDDHRRQRGEHDEQDRPGDGVTLNERRRDVE